MALPPPPPTNDAPGSVAWLEWFRKVREYVSTTGSIPWSIINFTGSKLSNIASRSHQVLQALQGGTTGEYYHLTSAHHTDLTDAGDSTLHYHAKDRDSANFTGTSWTDLTDAGATTLHKHAHNNMDSLQGGTTDEYYHLTAAQHATVSVAVSGVYTPTLTNVANLDASTAYQCQYMRVGTVVTVSGKVAIDPTDAVSTKLGISLPIASNFGAEEDCAGTAFAKAIASQGAAILGDAANDRAQLEYIAVDKTNQPMYFSFQYRII